MATERTRVYIGNLGSGAAKHEIEREFNKYGPLRDVWIARNPPGFAFVVFEDPLDAQDAVEALDGRRLCGTRVRVELARGDSHPSAKRPPTGMRNRGGGGGYGDRMDPDRYYGRRSRSTSRERYERPRRRSSSRDRYDGDRRERVFRRSCTPPYRDRFEPDFRQRRSRSRERYPNRRSISPARGKYDSTRYESGEGRYDSPSRNKYETRNRSRSRSRSPLGRKKKSDSSDIRYRSPRGSRSSPGRGQERRD